MNERLPSIESEQPSCRTQITGRDEAAFAFHFAPRYKVIWAFSLRISGYGPSTMSLYFPSSAEKSSHTIFPGVSITTCAAERMMLSLVTLEPGAVVEEHSHPHEQVGMVLEGKAVFFIGGEEKTLQPGDMYRIPGNVRHRVIALDQPVKALDIFHPIREDYL
jgi:quercetin dioxygenase-like cupin family protein